MFENKEAKKLFQLWFHAPTQGTYGEAKELMKFFWFFSVLNHLGLLPFVNACKSETLKSYDNIDGIRIEIVGVDCDTIAKEYDIHLFAREIGVSGGARLFEYAPAWSTDALPDIQISGTGEITISAARVSSISIQKYEWNGRKIKYNIGEILYPSPPAAGN